MTNTGNTSKINTFADRELCHGCFLHTSPTADAAQTTHFDKQTSAPLELPKTIPPGSFKDPAADLPKLTTSNLAKHTHQQTDLWADTEVNAEYREQLSNETIAAAQSLGIELPRPIMGSVARRLDGMTPMERYIGGSNNKC